MAGNTVQGLVLRIPNGAPLTAAQGDNNLTVLANFSNALSAAISLSLNPDGTLVNGALNSVAQVANIPTFADTFQASLSGVTSSYNNITNVYAITNPNLASIVAYAVGMKIQFLADASNVVTVGGVNINLNSIGNAYVRKGALPLAENDIRASRPTTLIYDGGGFQLQPYAEAATSTSQGLVTLAVASDVQAGTDPSKAVTSQALANAIFVGSGAGSGAGIINVSGNVATIPHGLPSTPQKVRFVLVCASTNLSYATGREIDASNFTSSSNIVGLVSSADATNVYLDYTSSGTTYPMICPAGGGARTAITPGDWSIKVYASAF